MADQLQTLGIYRSAKTLREEVVRDLRRNPLLPDGTPLNLFVGQNNLNAYLISMSNSGTFGDHITLARIAQMFNVQFVIFSSLGPAATRLISPSGAFEDLPVLFLAYEAEGAGEHYYSLAGDYNAQLRACSLFVDQGQEFRDSIWSEGDVEGSCVDRGVTEEEELVCDRGEQAEDEEASVELDGTEEEELVSDRRVQGEDEASVELEGTEGEECEDEGGALQGYVLPPELIMIIVGMAVHSDMRCIQKLSLVCKLWQITLTNGQLSTCPHTAGPRLRYIWPW